MLQDNIIFQRDLFNYCLIHLNDISTPVIIDYTKFLKELGRIYISPAIFLTIPMSLNEGFRW